MGVASDVHGDSVKFGLEGRLPRSSAIALGPEAPIMTDGVCGMELSGMFRSSHAIQHPLLALGRHGLAQLLAAWSVFVYTTASVTSATPRADIRFYRSSC